jgi:hypothetical protein
MGKNIIDQYSLLHFSTGCIAYFFGLTLINWILLHTLFELFENSPKGVYFIDNYLKFWPGGKKAPDTLKNSISDLIFAIIGYILASKIDLFYKQKKL